MSPNYLSCQRTCLKGDLITVYVNSNGLLSNIETGHKKTFEVVDMRYLLDGDVPPGYYPVVWPSSMYFAPVFVTSTKICRIKKYR